METRSKKRKQNLIPPNPYQRSFIRRKKDPISLNRSSLSSSASSSPHVKDLRARRVFSPNPSSPAKETAEGNQKEIHFDVGFSQNDEKADEKTQIDNNKEKLDLGVDLDGRIGEKETEFDVGVVDKDPNVGEIEGLCVNDISNQENETEVRKDQRVCEKDVAVIEGAGDGQIKSKLKLGSLVPCSRSKVYKNPASFSYKRMLPFLMDLAKDDANAPQIHPCQKVDKSVLEMPPASLSTSQETLVNATEKEILTDEQPVDESHTSPTAPNLECSNTESPEHHTLEATTPKSPETSMPCTVGNFAIRDLPRLFSEIASQVLKDTPDGFKKSSDAPYFVHDKSPPTKSSLSVVIPVSPLITEDIGLDKGRPNTNGNTESGSYEGEWVQSTHPDGDAFCIVGPGMNKDYALETHLNNKSDREMSRCMGENEKDRHPTSVEIRSYEGERIQSTLPDGDASCNLGPGTSKDCARESHLNNKSDHEINMCMGENEKDRHTNSVEIGSYEGEWIQSTPPDGDAFCKVGPGTSEDCALEGQLNNRSDHEKNRCVGGDEKDRHPNSKAKLGILFPSSRMRLYKAPGSFSYRRLLPYLMDLSRQDTNTLGTLPCNIDKTVDDRPPSSLASHDRHKSEPSKQTLTNGHSIGGRDVSPHRESAEMTSPTGLPVDCTSLESLEDPLVEFAIQNPARKSVVQEPPGNSIVSEVNGSVTTKPSRVHVESAPQNHQDTISKSNHVKPTQDITCTIPDSNLLIKSSPFLVSPEPSLLKEGSTGPYLLSEEVTDDGSHPVQKTITSLKSPGELSLIHEQSSIESPTTPIYPLSGSSNGILKKYPLGCRGICTCLNCASFRLHAERAFEFSRNQMQDTEEVATELMKELSSIRALLGNVIDGAESRVDFQVPEVKEICMKALRAEEWAKTHLEQMNQELNIHCRIPGMPRPKVRFADISQMQTLTNRNSQQNISSSGVKIFNAEKEICLFQS